MNENFDYEKVFMGLSNDKSSSDFQKLYKSDYRLRNLVEKIHIKNGRILDIGCGGGTLTRSLTYYYPQAQIFGCDISKTAIKFAKSLGRGKVKYDMIKNQKLPYKDNFFDVCLSLDVLEHVPDINLYLKEAKRVLKNNGLFYLVVPCEGQPFTLTSFFQKIKIGENLTYKNFGHIHPEFTHDYICRLLNSFNFKVCEKKFSFHIFSQIITFFQYYLPKEMLDFFLGKKKAAEYYDRNAVQKSSVINHKKDFFTLMRNLLFRLTVWTAIFGELEIRYLQNVGLTAGKITIIAQNNK